jgi:hypothetical protein
MGAHQRPIAHRTRPLRPGTSGSWYQSPRDVPRRDRDAARAGGEAGRRARHGQRAGGAAARRGARERSGSGCTRQAGGRAAGVRGGARAPVPADRAGLRGRRRAAEGAAGGGRGAGGQHAQGHGARGRGPHVLAHVRGRHDPPEAEHGPHACCAPARSSGAWLGGLFGGLPAIGIILDMAHNGMGSPLHALWVVPTLMLGAGFGMRKLTAKRAREGRAKHSGTFAALLDVAAQHKVAQATAARACAWRWKPRATRRPSRRSASTRCPLARHARARRSAACPLSAG